MDTRTKNRPRVSAYMALSLDGFVAGPGGELDWLNVVARENEDYGYEAFFQSVDGIILGRETFDTALSFGSWPYGSRPVAVFTHRELALRPGVEAHQGDLLPVLEEWDRRGVQHVYLDGGRMVCQGLREGLIDELTLSWIPTILGHGKPLFGGEVPLSSWGLVSARSFPSGLCQVVYRPENGPRP